MILEMNIR